MYRPTYAEIDLDAIRANVRAIRERVGTNVKIMPAVKANGYGHGAIEVSRAALEAGADMLGVASVEEALELRDANINAPILILGCVPAEAVDEIVRHCITTTVCDLKFGKVLSNAAAKLGGTVCVHIKVDTGMGRIGLSCDECEKLVGSLQTLPNLQIEGLFTHFPSADDFDPTFTKQQIHEFSDLITRLRKSGCELPYCHAANSAAIMAHPESYFDMVRPGIMFYGLHPSPGISHNIAIAPALSLKTKIIFLKEVTPGTPISYGRTFVAARQTKVATISVGYADGYNRHLSNRGEAIVRGRVVPVIGRVCMDQMMLDVTDIPQVSVGDDVTLYGGNGPVSVEKIAKKLNTIPYEVTCAISSRVPRVYLGKSSDSD